MQYLCLSEVTKLFNIFFCFTIDTFRILSSSLACMMQLLFYRINLETVVVKCLGMGGMSLFYYVLIQAAWSFILLCSRLSHLDDYPLVVSFSVIACKMDEN